MLIGDAKKYGSLDNNNSGFKKLLALLSKYEDDAHVCLEATGSYGFDLAEFFFAKNIKVSIVNPAKVKAFAGSELSRNKTDKLDSFLIARFAKEKSPKLWQAPTKQDQDLKAMYRRWEVLKHSRAQEKNRLSSERNQLSLSSIESHLAYLNEQIEAVEAVLNNIKNEDENLKQRYDLLTSIPGIGKVTAFMFMTEISFELFEDVRQVVAFAGLNPKLNQSGLFRGKSRISKTGSAAIRKTLYLPAVKAKQVNPLIIPLAQRMEAKGHCQMSIIVASMRKLIHLAFGVIKSKRPFDPYYRHSIATNELIETMT